MLHERERLGLGLSVLDWMLQTNGQSEIYLCVQKPMWIITVMEGLLRGCHSSSAVLGSTTSKSH